MNDYTVHQYGTDSSGRTIWMTAFMHDWWETTVGELGFRPVIIQGAFQERNAGGGAKASDGAHDKGGCIDVRTRDLTAEQIGQVVRVTRDRGAGSYRRDLTARHGGMDPHVHITLGADYPLSPMARTLWHSYVTGGDGLAAGKGRPADASDYEYRPKPLVLVPPTEEDDMAKYTDWDPADRKALAEDVADAVWSKTVPTADSPTKPRAVLNAIKKLYDAKFPAK